MNRSSRIVISAAGLSAVVISASMLMAENPAPALRKAPPAVQAAVIQLTGGNKVSDFDTETETGKTVYEVEYVIKGVEYSADIDPSGEILSREVEVDLSIVPPTVLTAATTAHADGKLSEAAIVTAGDKMYYEVEAKVGKDEHDMQIGAGGQVLADSIEAPEADEQPSAAKSGEKEDKEDKD